MTFSNCNTCKLQYICTGEIRKKLLSKGGDCGEYIPEEKVCNGGC
jgi:hypothetical protein